MTSGLSPETDLIQRVFAPLTLGHAGSFGLKDDAAFIAAGTLGTVITQDQVIEGTHFLSSDPLDQVAKRLVRRNLSDLIAKGALPTAAFLSLAWPKSKPRDDIAFFAKGLGADLRDLCDHCPLLGGDTSMIAGPLVASLTLLGRPTSLSGMPVLRSGAQVGDIVAVTGTIGDAWLGLQVRLGLFEEAGLSGCKALAMAPGPPPVAFAQVVGTYAKACIDVSDGLIGDGAQLAHACDLALALNLADLPVSREAFGWLDRQKDRAKGLLQLATGGDDYQCLMAVSPTDWTDVLARANAVGVALTAIGICTAGQGVSVSYGANPVALPRQLGWSV